jgi:hypothetical protein
MLKKYLENYNNRSKYFLETKQKVINDFKDNCLNIKQRSNEWYTIRKTTIGGSEMATVLGKNPFKKIKDLISEKIGISKFEGNVATRWGVLFEDVTKQWAEKCLLMKYKIIEIGNVEGINKRQRYSPDGLGVVKLSSELKLDDEAIIHEEYNIILFEFKSPLKSIPDSKIPTYYLPQILTGLLNIKICDYGIFINNVYRKCSINDINLISFNNPLKYDNNFHKDNDKKISCFNKVLGYGIIYISQDKTYFKNASYENSETMDNNENKNSETMDNNENKNSETMDNNENKNSETMDNNENKYLNKILLKSFSIDYEYHDYINSINNLDDLQNMIDFGNSSYYLIDELLKLSEKKRINIKYLPLSIIADNINEEIEFIKTHNKTYNHKIYSIDEYKKIILTIIKKNINKEYPIGYLPFKILKSNIILVDRDNEWEDNIKLPVEKTLNLIDEILNDKNPQNKYNEIFNIKIDNKKNKQDINIIENTYETCDIDNELNLMDNVINLINNITVNDNENTNTINENETN